MGLVLRCGNRLRRWVRTEENGTGNGRNPASNAWASARHHDGRGLV